MRDDTLPPDLSGTERLDLQRPPALSADDEPVLMHDELLTIIDDLRTGRDGVATLAKLLQCSPDGLLAPDGSALGLAALLEGTRARLDLAHDGLLGAAAAMGLEVI